MLKIKTTNDRLLAPLQQVTGIIERRHTLPILSNVLISASGSGVEFLATDLEVQITARAALDGSSEGAVTAGARKLHDILRSLPEDAEVSLESKENRMTVRAGKSRFNLQTLAAGDFPKMVEGKFPDYQKVIPSSHKNRVSLDRATLAQSLNRAAILSNEKIRGVRLVFTKDALSIICTNNEQEEAEEGLAVEYDGDPLDIGFNISYLLDVLNHVDSETVTFTMGDSNSSALVQMPGHDDFKYVVMPMRI